MKLSSKQTIEEAIDEHRRGTQLSVLKRHHDIMRDYHLDTLSHIEKAIKAGATPEAVKEWVREICKDNDFIEKCYNAARYLVESANS